MEAVPYAGLVGSFMTDESSIQQAYITSEPCIVRSKGGSPVFLEARAPDGTPTAACWRCPTLFQTGHPNSWPRPTLAGRPTWPALKLPTP